MITIDAKDMIAGRLGTYVAKQALMGEEVHVVNAEEAVLTGRPKEILSEYKRKREMGAPGVGPIFIRTPERLLKRIIKGMLPHKKTRGREALSRIKCHVGIPSELEKEKLVVLENAHVSRAKNTRYIKIKEISKELGARV